MTDKLNRVWVRDRPYEPDWTADPDLVTKAHVEHVRRSDYDALAAKLAEVEAMLDATIVDLHNVCVDAASATARAEAVEVCAICDIAGCYHIRERKARAETATPANPLADERVRKLIEVLENAVKWTDQYKWAAPWTDDARAALAAISEPTL